MNDKDFYRDVKFVDDHPASSDEFRGQPHHSVANTLASIITTGEGGRAIGLEGTWGSGKSTVIDIARSKLQEHDKKNTNGPYHSIFVFDAWAHQSDPLRRVFLQELIQSLDSNNAVDKVHWTEQLEILETRRKKTTESKAEKLSGVAIVTLLSIPFYPLAYGLVTYSLTKPDSSTFLINLPFLGSTCLPYWYISALIILLPFLAAGITWVMWRQGWQTSWKLFSRPWWRRKSTKQDKSIIWAFTRQTDHVTSEILIREEEATTIEFNSIFDELINDAASNNYKVIIVFDNLDRLPPELIQSAWATMRNFFASAPGTSRQSALKNVWLIVPFDRAHIENVFSRDKSDEKDGTAPGFIEKTFEILLRVAPPILSNWHEFLSSKIRYSFENRITAQETYQVFKIFDAYNRLHTKTITPRAIIAFVNTIAAQAKQWGNLIPLEHQALYALYKDDISHNVAQLQDSTILSGAMRAQISNPEWVKFLAAAHYNIPPDDALEFLLSSEIENSIQRNDTNRLAELRDTSGFQLVLDNVITQFAPDWAVSNPTLFIDAACTLSEIKLEDESVSTEIWRKMCSNIRRVDKVLIPSDRTTNGLRALVTKGPSVSRLSTAKEVMRMLTLDPPGEAIDNASKAGAAWYSLVEVVHETLRGEITESERHSIFSDIPVRANIDFLFGVAIAARKSEKLTFELFKPNINADDIAGRIVKLIEEKTPVIQLPAIVQSFVLRPESVAWEKIVEAVEKRLRGGDPPLNSILAINLMLPLVAILVDERTRDMVTDPIEGLIVDGSLHGILKISKQDDNSDLIALVLEQIMAYRPGQVKGPDNHPQYGTLAEVNQFLNSIQAAPDDPELIEKLAKFANENNHFSEILVGALPEDSDREIYRAVFRSMVDLGTYKKLRPLDILENTTRISKILEKDGCIRLLRKFDSWDIEKVISGEGWQKIDAEFLIISKPLSTKNFQTIIDEIHESFSAFTADRWVDSLSKEDNALKILLVVTELGNPPEMKAPLYDALKVHTETLVEEAPFPKRSRDGWYLLPNLLKSANRNQFFKWLRDRIIDKNPDANVLRQLLDLFGPAFTSGANLAQKAGDVVRVIIDPILAEGSAESVACIRRHAQGLSEAVEATSEDDREGLTDRLTQLYSNASQDEKASLDELAAVLRLQIKRSEPPEEFDQASDESESGPPGSASKEP